MECRRSLYGWSSILTSKGMFFWQFCLWKYNYPLVIIGPKSQYNCCLFQSFGLTWSELMGFSIWWENYWLEVVGVMSFLQWEDQIGVRDWGTRFSTLIWYSFLSPAHYTNSGKSWSFLTDGNFHQKVLWYGLRYMFLKSLRIVVMGPD